MSLFWAFVNSSVNVETAKSAYGLIIAGANLGSITGPTIAITQVKRLPMPLQLYSAFADRGWIPIKSLIGFSVSFDVERLVSLGRVFFVVVVIVSLGGGELG